MDTVTSADPFVSVFGHDRGHLEAESDSVLSKCPNARSKEALGALHRTVEGSDADSHEAFAIFAAMHATVDKRPMEKKVCGMLARHYTRQAVLDSEPILSRVVSDTAIYDSAVSEHLIEVAPNQPNLSFPAPSIHLWVHGHLYREPTDTPPGKVFLACCHKVPSDQVVRAGRGSWNIMYAPGVSGGMRCEACLETLRAATRYIERLRKDPSWCPPPEEMDVFRANSLDSEDIKRVIGETQDNPHSLSALPYYTSRPLRKHLLGVTTDRLIAGVAASNEEQESLARADYMALALSSAVSCAHQSLPGWMMRLGIDVSPVARRKNRPLISKDEIADLLRTLYPPIYHIRRDWQTLGYLDAWEDWLASNLYRESLLRFKDSVREKVETSALLNDDRSSSWPKHGTHSGSMVAKAPRALRRQ